MADELKNPGDQKPVTLKPPKDIENLLKELPKIDPPKPAVPLPRPTVPNLPPQKPQMPPPPLPPQSAKSFVRTMAEDLEAAKKGIKPEPKPFEIKLPPSLVTPPAIPKMAPLPPPLKMPSAPQIKLGPSEKTKPLELPKLGPPSPSLPARKKFALNPKSLILILIIIAAVFAGTWFFLTREPEETAILTPTPSPTPNPTPKTFSELIPSSNQIIISSTEDFSITLNDKIKLLIPTVGDFTILEIFDENQNGYTLSDFFARLNISATRILDSLDPSGAAILLYGQQKMFDDKGVLNFNQTPKAKIVLIARSVSPASTRNSLNNWEITMTNDLKALFGINPTKATSQTFLDNIYSGTDIRYRNFPFADSTIDYAVVNLAKFNTDYLILAGSRESIYSAIDLLQRQ